MSVVIANITWLAAISICAVPSKHIDSRMWTHQRAIASNRRCPANKYSVHLPSSALRRTVWKQCTSQLDDNAERLGDNARSRIIRKAIASGILQNALYPNQEFEALSDAGVNIKQDDAYLD